MPNASAASSFVIHEGTQLHEFRLLFVLCGELVERVVHSRKLVVIRRQGQIHVLDIHPLLVSTAADCVLAAGAVNEDAAHLLGGGGETSRAAWRASVRSNEPVCRFEAILNPSVFVSAKITSRAAG